MIYQLSVVELAYQIIDLHNERDRLRREVADLQEYRDKYNELLYGSIHHSEKMMGNLLTALLDRAEHQLDEGETP
jgi:hypothetical protein